MKNYKRFYQQASMESGFFQEKNDYCFSIIESLLGTPPKKSLEVLDLGCYDGRFGKSVYKKFGFKIDGADFSSRNLAKAKYLKRKILLDLDSGKSWAIGRKYDLVVAGDVIEHLFHTDEFMINVNRVLRVKGTLLLSTPNVASLGRRIKLLFGQNPYLEVSQKKEINCFEGEAVGHIRYFTKETLLSLVQYYGFKVSTFHGSTLNLPLGIVSHQIPRLFPSLGWHFTIVAQKIKEV